MRSRHAPHSHIDFIISDDMSVSPSTQPLIHHSRTSKIRTICSHALETCATQSHRFHHRRRHVSFALDPTIHSLERRPINPNHGTTFHSIRWLHLFNRHFLAFGCLASRSIDQIIQDIRWFAAQLRPRSYHSHSRRSINLNHAKPSRSMAPILDESNGSFLASHDSHHDP